MKASSCILIAAFAAGLVASPVRAEPQRPTAPATPGAAPGSGSAPAPRTGPTEPAPPGSPAAAPLAPSPTFAPPVVTAVPDTATAAQQPQRPEPVTAKWWFWAAVGGVLLVTVGVLAIASSAPEPPATRLGDMEAFRVR